MALKTGAWSETALVTITKLGSANVEFAALTETIDIDMGDKDVDQIANVGGGRMMKKTPQDITTLTFEGYPVDIDSAGGSGYSQMFEGGTWDTQEPYDSNSSLGRDLFRVTILWTDDTSVTSAVAATSASTNAYRVAFVHCWMTSLKPSFTDGILKFTISFKCPAFNPLGTANIRESSGDNTALVALTGYTTSNYPPYGTSYTWS